MITTGTQTELGFGIVEADPGVEFGWRIRSGRCSGSGSPLTTAPQAFPAITTDEAGQASVTVTFGGSASETEEYAAEVYLEAELVGCGDMVLQ
jgi:hypothetical protein